MKKQVIRVGDQVQVIKNLIVKRVGYPLVWHEIAEEVEDDLRTLLAYQILKGDGDLNPKELAALCEKVDVCCFLSQPPNLPRYFVQAAAKLRVESRGFGGKERTIHYWPQPEPGELWVSGRCGPDLLDRVFCVEGKRVAKTGTRFPASGGVDHAGEYWEEPGGLDNEKTHVLLKLSGGWEIEECNVKLVKRA